MRLPWQQKIISRQEHFYGQRVESRFKRFFYERVSQACRPQWHHGRAYYDPRYDINVAVIYPFHWVVQFAWWLNLKWSYHRGKPSWIDLYLREQKKPMHYRYPTGPMRQALFAHMAQEHNLTLLDSEMNEIENVFIRHGWRPPQ